MPHAEARHMTSGEVAEAVVDGRVAVVPVGVLETHDPHLPIDTDTRLTEAVVLGAARERPDVITVYPPVHYGYTEHTMDFPGGVTIRPQILMEVYYDIGISLARNGFKRILLVNGHGSNVNVMNLAVRLVTMHSPSFMAAVTYADLCRGAITRLRESEYPGGMAHSCEFEVSNMLHVDPAAVRVDLIEDCIASTNNEWTFGDTVGAGPIHLVPHFSQISEIGTEGRPSLATAEKGAAFIGEATENLIRFCAWFRELELPPKRDRRPEEYRWDPAR